MQITEERVTIQPITRKMTVSARFITILMTIAVLAMLLLWYNQTAQSVTIIVNGEPFYTRTHRLTVDTVLAQTGIALAPQDRLNLARNSGLPADHTIEIVLARPVRLDVGITSAPITLLTHAQTPAEIFAEQGITISPADDIFVDGVRWDADTPLPTTIVPETGRFAPLRARIEAMRPQPVQLTRHRAVPVTINDGERSQTILSTAQTIGEVLVAQGIPIFEGDAFNPPLSAPLTPDTTITIERSVPVEISVDGKRIKTRTRAETVGGVLAQEGVMLVGQDYTRPAENAPLSAGKTIEVVRVTEALEIEKETTDFETIYMPDPNLEIDHQEVQQPGQQGITKTRTRVRYENGEEVFRQTEETWLAQEPADKIIAYGTNIIVRTLKTPDGEIEYWRKIRMLATSYSAATSGKGKDHPAYGITRTGLQAGYGVVAVDPGVVPLWSKVYVPGYGEAVAGDTGGAIIGKHIDLGFDEDNPPLWYTWVDVYVETPIPRWDKIRYVLPEFPQER